MGTMMNDHDHRRWPCFKRYIIHKWVMFHLPMGKLIYEILKINRLILKITNFERTVVFQPAISQGVLVGGMVIE